MFPIFSREHAHVHTCPLCFLYEEALSFELCIAYNYNQFALISHPTVHLEIKRKPITNSSMFYPYRILYIHASLVYITTYSPAPESLFAPFLTIAQALYLFTRRISLKVILNLSLLYMYRHPLRVCLHPL